MKIINRPLYLDKVMRLLEKGMMVIITSQRRVGKSYLFLDDIWAEKLSEHGGWAF